MNSLEILAKTNPDLVIDLGSLKKETLVMLGEVFEDIQSELETVKAVYETWKDDLDHIHGREEFRRQMDELLKGGE